MAAPGKDTARLDFQSPEEFNATCRLLSARLGYLNRVTMGEKGFVVDLADMLSELGRVFEQHHKDKDINAAFGDGWTPATLTREERRAALFKLLFDHT